MKRKSHSFDPVQLEILKNLFHSIAEEMGAVLRRSAFSPNIKERRDYSCSIFDAKTQAIAMGDHMPVHLGSMPASVQWAVRELDLGPGDAALLNDPYAGGTHLPDLTVVMPVYVARHRGRGPAFYVANRAHHADVGGASAGSMGLAREIFQEGLRIPPVKILQGGRLNPGVLAMLFANTRSPCEREGDLTAQIAACRTGERRILQSVAKYGLAKVLSYCGHLLEYSYRMMRALLREIPDGTYRALDYLDDDGISPQPVPIRVAIRIAGARAQVDFTGSAPQCQGSVNAVRAIAESAVMYVFRCLLDDQVPATSGLLRPFEIVAPEGTVVNARLPAAVAGGNVETSQRIVDTLLRALAKAIPGRIPAASQGTMNNFTFGGVDSRPGHGGQAFAYYETIAGGMGARPTRDGVSAIHTHMTNSLNTPVEVLEHTYPVRVQRYAIRRGSGGEGRYKGGDGITREVELLVDAQVALLSDRRKIGPYGLRGGGAGQPGENAFRPGSAGKRTKLSSKCSFYAASGSLICIETPGGGGWGKGLRKKGPTKEGNPRGAATTATPHQVISKNR
jgi:N-methylhydantoinase B